jgi:hypothetical protein
MDLYPNTTTKPSTTNPSKKDQPPPPQPSSSSSSSSSDTSGGDDEPDRMLLQSIKVSVPIKTGADKFTDSGMKLKEGPRDSGPKLKLKVLDCVFIESDNFEMFHGESIKPSERSVDLRPSPSSPPNCFRALVVLCSDASLSFYRFGRLNQLGLYEIVAAGRAELPLQQVIIIIINITLLFTLFAFCILV